MSKHLEALTNKCNERFTQISTPDLQAEMNQKLKLLEEKLGATSKESSDARDELDQQIKQLQEQTNQITGMHSRLIFSK